MTTPLDSLVVALRETANFNPGAESAPEAIVWCDPNGEFLTLIPTLSERLPELVTYGAHDPVTRTGPAVWLRAVVARAVPSVSIPDEATPILYLPGVGREVLKGAEDCPTLLQPLVWFTVAGNLFGHVNGKDWTLRAFLTSDRGPLKLNIADDASTRMALSHAALRFGAKPLEELKGKRWDADALNALLAPDLAADMLDWMDGVFDAAADPARFTAFASIAEKQLKFDPRKLSVQDAARRLAQREGNWADVWSRFASGMGHGGVVGLLGAEEPATLFENAEAYPKQNLKGEKELRDSLSKLESFSAPDARSRILELEGQHGWRRETVWAKRGEAPLAQALSFLVEVAKAKPLQAHDGNTLAEAYIESGAAVDFAAMRALAAASRDVDRNAVSVALRAVYLPWLEDGANALQELIRSGGLKLQKPEDAKSAATTILFVDGLRMDLAQELARILESENLNVVQSWKWSGFPTVTATCKALVSPVASLLSGPPITSDMLPVTSEGKAATKPVLYKLLEEQGWETGNALLADTKLWAEAGRFDEDGHALGARLAGQLAAGIRDVADSVVQLIRSGRTVRIVTDHGWLLMPGGLPKAALETGLVEPQGKRSRCAMVKAKAHTTYLQIPWTWNPEVFVATATGAHSFFAGQEYAHGGVSPQECILPILDITASGVPQQDIGDVKTKWEGLRLRVEVSGATDLRVDLRLGSETSGPSMIKGGRVLDDKGKTSFLVSDENVGHTACLVLVDDNGTILAHRVLKVGGE
ncbi:MULTISPECIES: BREX-1 system phosphatase PglZ type B [Rhizobium]|uniref:BREX-1 system phosphatase PglZ type B n=1 Tax=Rhizobium TaxID=379 RepID=UPI000FEC97BA|nr:BREX-1 system phosphatase PglZ type B [Rhizobium leguminosarum]RWX23630.1 BREX-1 system phosphatase PglZ type B [Rhizobium leguminosarum]